MQCREGDVRTFFPQADRRIQAVLEPRRFVRWVYVGRLSLATAIFIAGIVQWPIALPERTLVATLCFVGALFFTGASFFWTEVNRRPLTEAFLYGQLIVDLLVVTAVVHVTSSPALGSQFAALYILVNAAAALLLPIGGALLIALLGSVLYVADALMVSDVTPATFLQLGVFSAVAVAVGYISARLQEAGQGRELLAAELATVRLREKDILTNIRSGILTVDNAGALLFANPAAAELLGIDLEAHIGRPVRAGIRAVYPRSLMRWTVPSACACTRSAPRRSWCTGDARFRSVSRRPRPTGTGSSWRARRPRSSRTSPTRSGSNS